MVCGARSLIRDNTGWNTVTCLSHSYFKWQANKRLARMSTNKWNWKKKYVHIIFRALSMPINARTHKLASHAHTLSFLDGIHCPMLWHVCNSKDIWPSSIGLLSSYYYYIINFSLPPPHAPFPSLDIHQSVLVSPECKWQMKIVKRNQRFQEINFKCDEKFLPHLHSTIIIQRNPKNGEGEGAMKL